MKYYNTKNPIQNMKREEANQQQEKIINEEGDVINNEPDAEDGYDGEPEGNLGLDDLVAPENVVVGFEENLMPLEGLVQDAKAAVNNLKDMFKIDATKSFNAFGGANQKIEVNPFAIRKQVDVKRLKFQLWDYMRPQLEKVDQIQRQQKLQMTQVLGELY